MPGAKESLPLSITGSKITLVPRTESEDGTLVDEENRTTQPTNTEGSIFSLDNSTETTLVAERYAALDSTTQPTTTERAIFSLDNSTETTLVAKEENSTTITKKHKTVFSLKALKAKFGSLPHFPRRESSNDLRPNKPKLSDYKREIKHAKNNALPEEEYIKSVKELKNLNKRFTNQEITHDELNSKDEKIKSRLWKAQISTENLDEFYKILETYWGKNSTKKYKETNEEKLNHNLNQAREIGQDIHFIVTFVKDENSKISVITNTNTYITPRLNDEEARRQVLYFNCTRENYSSKP